MTSRASGTRAAAIAAAKKTQQDDNRRNGPITKRRKKIARNIRPTARVNPDGTVSTVKMQTVDVGGKHPFLATPTLFPKKGGGFIELPKGKASLDEAKKRGEVFGFKKAGRAAKFAAGGFKKGVARKEALRKFREQKRRATAIKKAKSSSR